MICPGQYGADGRWQSHCEEEAEVIELPVTRQMSWPRLRLVEPGEDREEPEAA